MSTPLESAFQSRLRKQIGKLLPGAILIKLPSGNKQGIPDLLILYKSKWATLECKRSATASHRPNQDWYVKTMDHMSFSRFIYPENRDKILKELLDFMKTEKGHDQNEIQPTLKPYR